MRAVHARPVLAAGKRRAIGTRVVGTLGAVALAATLLTGCGDDQDTPAEAGSTASPSAPQESSGPSATAGQGSNATPSDDATPDDGATAGSSGESGDGSDEPSADPDQDGKDDAGSGESGDEDSSAGDASDDAAEDDAAGDPADEDRGAGKGDKDEDGTGAEKDEPEKPDHIEFGEVSKRVGALQQRLQDLGYFMTSVDKTYGAETQQAVFALQKAGGLYRDGVVGKATESAVDKGIVTEAHSSSGKVLEIDVDRQHVLAVGDGRVD